MIKFLANLLTGTFVMLAAFLLFTLVMYLFTYFVGTSTLSVATYRTIGNVLIGLFMAAMFSSISYLVGQTVIEEIKKKKK